MGSRLKAAAFGLFALFALVALAGARAAFAQDDDASGASDANWERVDSGSADSTGQVLEIPQAACGDDVSIPCDDGSSAGNAPNDDDSIPTGVALSPASPQTYDDDTANAGSDWANADDYANETIYGFPYGAAQYGAVPSKMPTNGNPPQVRRSPFPFSPMDTSSPVTQAATPPLNTGSPWMTPPSMTAFGRPAGNPMAGMPFRFH